VKNFGGVWICGFCQSIVGPFALATGGDESGALEVGEVSRDLRLIRLEHLDAVADAEFFVTQHLNKPQPGTVGEGFEKCFETFLHLLSVYDFAARHVQPRITRRNPDLFRLIRGQNP
jgi:hypothetical protein